MLNITKNIQNLPATDIAWKNTFRKEVYQIIPNRRYTDGVINLIKGIYESTRRLNIDFKDVKLGDWLMFQQAEREFPARNITLKDDGNVFVTTLDGRAILKPKIANELFYKIIDEKERYSGRVVIKNYGIDDGTMHVYGEVQIAISNDFYYKHMVRYKVNHGKFFGGVDVNVDRLNLAIIDVDGKLRDYRTFWFEGLVARGVSKKVRSSVIGNVVHRMLDYAYNNGVFTIVLESSSILGQLKLIWIKSNNRRGKDYNYKVSIFSNDIIEFIKRKAPLYAIRIIEVSPGRTTNSDAHDTIMRKYGLDRHTASAYLIGLRGVGKF